MTNENDRRMAYGQHIVGVMTRVVQSPGEPLFACPHVSEDLPHKQRKVPAAVCAAHPEAGVLCPPCAAAHEASHDVLECVACRSEHTHATTAAGSTTWIAPVLAVERVVTSFQGDDYEGVAADPTPVTELYTDVLLKLYDVMVCAECLPLFGGSHAA